MLSAADCGESDPDAATSANLATAAALSTAVSAAEDCIQIHGGIGFTWEHPAHLLLRRATANEAWIGRPEVLRDRAVGEVFDRLS